MQNHEPTIFASVPRGRKRAFTLLEVLIAMAILMLIVLMMSGLFQHSKYAWSTAIRKTEMTMEGRSALNFMTLELSEAMADGVALKGGSLNSGNTIEFYALGDATTTNREIKKMFYQLQGDTVQRTITYYKVGGGAYPQALGSASAPLVTNVVGLSFTVPSGGPYTTNLPEWIDISLTLRKNIEYAVVRAYSYGPDKQNGTDDDIKTWIYQP